MHKPQKPIQLTRKLVTISVEYMSGESLLKELLALKGSGVNLSEVSLECDVGGYDGYVEDITLEYYRTETEEELNHRIKAYDAQVEKYEEWCKRGVEQLKKELEGFAKD